MKCLRFLYPPHWGTATSELYYPPPGICPSKSIHCCYMQPAPPNAGTFRWEATGGLTWELLIWLLVKNRANSKLRSSSQMMSSHFFLPRSSSTGREQKSSCHTDA